MLWRKKRRVGLLHNPQRDSHDLLFSLSKTPQHCVVYPEPGDSPRRLHEKIDPEIPGDLISQPARSKRTFPLLCFPRQLPCPSGNPTSRASLFLRLVLFCQPSRSSFPRRIHQPPAIIPPILLDQPTARYEDHPASLLYAIFDCSRDNPIQATLLQAISSIPSLSGCNASGPPCL